MKALTELHGRRAVARQAPDGTWQVVTAFLGEPMGTRFATGKFGPPGPTFGLTEDWAVKLADEWDRFLEALESGDDASDRRKRTAPSPSRARTR